MESLRILVAADVPPDPNGGASGTVFQMNNALRRMGHDVDEIWQPELGRRIQHGNLHYLLELPRTYRQALRRHLQRRDYDVVEFNQPPAYLAAAHFQRCRNRGVFVSRSHGHEVRVEETLIPWRNALGVAQTRGVRGLLSRCLRPWLDRHWTRIARSADGFHVSCTEDAEFLSERYDIAASRIGVVTQGIPELFLKTAVHPMTELRRRRLLYVGQLAFFKAPIILAQAISQLLTARSDLTMTWVCSRTHHSEVRGMLAPEIQSRVTLCDWRPQNELIDIYDNHGLFLFPSFFEGFGKAPLEAMSRGLCVVASSTGGMRDYIDDGKTGTLVPIGRVDMLVQATLVLVDDSAACMAMSCAARGAALRHTWDRCAQDATRFYRRLLFARQSSADHVITQSER